MFILKMKISKQQYLLFYGVFESKYYGLSVIVKINIHCCNSAISHVRTEYIIRALDFVDHVLI